MSELIDRERFSADMRDFQNRVGIWRDEAEDTETRTRADAALATIIETKLILDKQPTIPAPRWHMVEEPPKEYGLFLCAAKHERNGQTHWFFELCWYADGDLKDVVFDAEQDSGFYSWSESQDRDIDAKVDYWMPIEQPKEDA